MHQVVQQFFVSVYVNIQQQNCSYAKTIVMFSQSFNKFHEASEKKLGNYYILAATQKSLPDVRLAVEAQTFATRLSGWNFFI